MCDTCATCTGRADLDLNASTVCVLQCGLGEHPHGGSVNCTGCAAGRADVDNNPSTPCSQWVDGKYMCTSGHNTSCDACSAGQADLDSDAATPCHICSPGHYMYMYVRWWWCAGVRAM